jgi:LacI family transcriptional regulator
VGDDQLGGYLATRHLLDLGHRRIGLIAGPAYASSSSGRVAGYRPAMVETGVAVDPTLVQGESFSIDAGVAAAEALMCLPDPPTAIFAVNDNTAFGAMSALRRMDLAIPDDVSLVGHNDIPIVSRLGTPMSTVRVPFDQIAASTLDLLSRGPPEPATASASHADAYPTTLDRGAPAQTVSSGGSGVRFSMLPGGTTAYFNGEGVARRAPNVRLPPFAAEATAFRR